MNTFSRLPMPDQWSMIRKAGVRAPMEFDTSRLDEFALHHYAIRAQFNRYAGEYGTSSQAICEVVGREHGIEPRIVARICGVPATPWNIVNLEVSL